MSQLKDVIAYILQNYPNHMQHELSNARVTKMVYLADWHQAITKGRQITNIQWYFDNYGPYVNDIKQEAENSPQLFSINNTTNMFGQPKVTLSLSNNSYTPTLSDDEKDSIDHVIEQTQKMYWDSFIKLVYSTYPITSSNRYTHLDLVQRAQEYLKSK